MLISVLWIRNSFLDPDPELLFRIQQQMKELKNKEFISFFTLGLWILDWRTIVLSRKWKIFGTGIIFYIDYKVFLKDNLQIRLNNIDTIWFGSGNLNICSRFRNISFRIHNAVFFTIFKVWSKA